MASSETTIIRYEACPLGASWGVFAVTASGQRFLVLDLADGLSAHLRASALEHKRRAQTNA